MGTPATKRTRKAQPPAPTRRNVFNLHEIQKTHAEDEEGIVVSPIYDASSGTPFEQPEGSPASITIPGPTASRARVGDLRATLARLEKAEAQKSNNGAAKDEEPALPAEETMRLIQQNHDRNALRFAHSIIAWTLYDGDEERGYTPVPLTPENALLLFQNRPSIVDQLAFAEVRHKETFRGSTNGAGSAGEVAGENG